MFVEILFFFFPQSVLMDEGSEMVFLDGLRESDLDPKESKW